MLGKVQAPSNSLNVSQRIITEPSEYLEKLKIIITDKQKVLYQIISTIKKTLDELETNIDLMKQKIYTLESVKTKLDQELEKNNILLDKTQDTLLQGSINDKNKEILAERQKIDAEISQKLSQINELESSVEQKEKEWNKSKKELIQRIKQFQDQQLIPSLNKIENIMQLTNSKIEASNTKLTKSMQTEINFGASDPFVNIGQKFNEKLINNQDLFSNSFGENKNENEEANIDVEEIDEIDIIEDSDSDEDMEFGSELESEESENEGSSYSDK